MMGKTAEQIAAGLTHQIGGTDFSVTFGAHWPWDYLLRYKGEPIAGISNDFFAAARQIRAIIAREVAAAEPSNEALGRMIDVVLSRYNQARLSIDPKSHIMAFAHELRAALKGEGA